ncbi:hypothetical protein [Gandjariella thermophila]|uniref:Uncharacterized protein n=1 Tax=Gandjariella thermophila TaxID=1931992 RepID=A0A4D4J2U5_9PSEU|nr:hypothetical protein [Gandjariella thermophila]GDY30955.1 hypothetical protein GTS_25880 [Gandjariella thermophila]
MTNEGCPGEFPRDDRPDEAADTFDEAFGGRGRGGAERPGDHFPGGEFADDDGGGDVDEGFAPGVVRGTVHTVCHLCGGMGEIADPVLAVRGGAPFTVNPGRPCPACAGEGHLPGLQPPV